MWDDRYLSNSDFAFIYPFFVTEEINKLEMKFLELLQYNVVVKSALYAKYYFEMRGLFEQNEAEFPLQPMEKKDFDQLEQNSSELMEKIQSANQRVSSTFGGVSAKPMW